MRVFFLILALFFLSSVTFGAQTSKEDGGNVPTYIEAKSAFSDNKKRITEFKDNVVVIRGDLKIYCDRLIVETDENNRIKKATAIGNVKVVKGDLTVVSQIAYYFPNEDKVIFEGNPKAIKGKDVVTGSRITYYLKEERSIVESNKSKGKVNVIIAPKTEEKK